MKRFINWLLHRETFIVYVKKSVHSEVEKKAIISSLICLLEKEITVNK